MQINRNYPNFRRVRKNEKYEYNSDLWDNMYMCNICAVGIRREEKNDTEKYLKK